MKQMKRIATIFLAVLMLVTVVPMGVIEGSAAYSMTWDDYYGKVQSFIGDSRWSAGTFWGDSQGPKLSSWSSSGCCAYAADFTKYVFGAPSQRSGDEFYNAADIRAGDVLYLSPDHWVAVLSRSDSILYTAEGNCSSRVRVTNTVYRVNGNSFSGSDKSFVCGYHYLNVISDNHNPVGRVEGCTGGPSCVFMDGWVFDRDNLSATVDLRVYIGGDAGSGEYHLAHTGYSRPDVNATYGCGNNHGIYTTIPTKKTGTQDVYVYAVNIGSGSDVLLGKFTVTMKPGFALEMNGRVNGSSVSNLSGYGTVDFYVDGELIGNDITDISASTGRFAWGAKYEIKDIKAKAGYAYNGVYSGNLTGTFMDGVNLTVVLDFISSSSTLKIDPNGGTWNGSSSVQSFKQNSYTTKSIPEPTRNGYTFTGWTRNGTNGTLSSTTGAATYTYGPTNNATDTITATWKCNHAATTLINQKVASYDAEGYSGDTYCTVCNQTISYGHVLPKLDPVTPDQPQQGDVCRWCGQNHGGAFGWLVRIFHNIFAALFGARY